MEQQLINYIINGVFFLVIGFFSLVSLLTIYTLVKYGRSRGIAVVSSLVFIVIFVIGSVTVYKVIQNIF